MITFVIFKFLNFSMCVSSLIPTELKLALAFQRTSCRQFFDVCDVALFDISDIIIFRLNCVANLIFHVTFDVQRNFKLES